MQGLGFVHACMLILVCSIGCWACKCTCMIISGNELEGVSVSLFLAGLLCAMYAHCFVRVPYSSYVYLARCIFGGLQH